MSSKCLGGPVASSFLVEGLEDRQLLSVAPLLASVTPSSHGSSPQHAIVVSLPVAPKLAPKPAPKPTIGPKLKDGAPATFRGGTHGTDPRGNAVTDTLTLRMSKNADGSWEGEVTIVNDQSQKAAETGHLKLDAAGHVIFYQQSNGETITVNGQASADWSKISGTYTGSDGQGHTWGGRFSVVRV